MIRSLMTLGAVLALTACERVVDVDVAEGPVRLVVEARLERVLGNVKGVQEIRLSTTAPYFSNAAPPAARGATVTVSDQDGRIWTFDESLTPGTYLNANLVVTAGTRYTLDIRWQGARYRGTETGMPVPPIDSIYLDKPMPGRFSGTEGLRATIDLRDIPNVKNWYLWDQFVDGVRLLGPDSTFKARIIGPDEAFKGIEIKGFQPFEGVPIQPGSTVLVRQVGISEATYQYLLAFSNQVQQDGSPFSVPPTSVRGNVANLDDPARPALGYFSVSEVAEARITRPR